MDFRRVLRLFRSEELGTFVRGELYSIMMDKAVSFLNSRAKSSASAPVAQSC